MWQDLRDSRCPLSSQEVLSVTRLYRHITGTSQEAVWARINTEGELQKPHGLLPSERNSQASIPSHVWDLLGAIVTYDDWAKFVFTCEETKLSTGNIRIGDVNQLPHMQQINLFLGL